MSIIMTRRSIAFFSVSVIDRHEVNDVVLEILEHEKKARNPP